MPKIATSATVANRTRGLAVSPRGRVVVLILLSLGLTAGLLMVHAPGRAAQPKLQPPTFTKKQLADAEALIREVFSEEFAQAKTDRSARLKLAHTLLDQSKHIQDEADVRFVVLSLATELSGNAGDRDTAFAAIAEMVKHYQVDAARLQGDALVKVIENTSDMSVAKDLAEKTLAQANSLAEQERFTEAVRFATLAEAAAEKSKDAKLLESTAARRSELAVFDKELAHLQPFFAKLKANPKDPAANLEIGRSLCFVRDKWERGLPYLAKGSDAVLKKIAATELSVPAAGVKQAQLGHAWWDAAQQQSGTTKLQMLRRSYQWYIRSVQQLHGDERAEAEARIKQLLTLLPAKLRITEIDTQLQQLTGHEAEVLAVALAPDGIHALTASADKTLRLWSLATGKSVRVFSGHDGAVLGAAFTPAGKEMISCSDDKTVRLWDVARGKVVREFKGAADVINSVAISGDGKYVAGAGQDRRVYVWELATGQKVHQLAGHTGPVTRVAFSPDGQVLASAAEDQTARVWDVAAGKTLKQLRGHTDAVLTVAVAPGGKRVLTGSSDFTARLWDAATGQEIQRFEGHTNLVGAVAFSPDGSRVVTGSDDRTLRLWEAGNGQLVRTLQGHTLAVTAIAYSADGRWLLSGSADKSARLWGARQ